MVTMPAARLPEGLRVYAIGDVHGCLELLCDTAAAIAADLAARPVGDWRVVLLGDYVDRGPDSRGVLDWLAARRDDPRLVALAGNHDAMFRDALADGESPSLATWLHNGGIESLASYGVGPPAAAALDTPDGRARFRRTLVAAVPPAHRDLLGGLGLCWRAGDFLFVHAGIRPGRDPAAQDEADLLWIREPFLDSTADHGVVVVHGHTPARSVVLRPNRIGIDTGAVFGGGLTCLAIEGDRLAVIGPDGARPIALTAAA